jgi:2-methylcitrate dehydratase PrpD
MPRDDDTATLREGISGRLARYALSTDWTDIPDAVRRRAQHHILDATGIALASTAFDFADRTLAGLQSIAGEGGSVGVIGKTTRLPPRDAAIMNGVLCHGLDFDDTHLGGVVHPTASAFPTALAAGVMAGADGKAMMTAYIVGVEAAARLGAVAKGGFHRVGFHPSGSTKSSLRQRKALH